MGVPTGPLRSRPESFRYYLTGGFLYLVGALMVGTTDQSLLTEVAEVGFLLAGSAVVAVAFLIDRGTIRPPA